MGISKALELKSRSSSVVDELVVLVVVLVVVLAVVEGVVLVVLVVMGILTGVVLVTSLVTRMGLRWSVTWGTTSEILKIVLVSTVVVALAMVEELVGLLDSLGLFHKLSAPPWRNQGGKGLLVVVAKRRGAHAKWTSTYLWVPGQGSPKTSEFTSILHRLCPSHLQKIKKKECYFFIVSTLFWVQHSLFRIKTKKNWRSLHVKQ